MGDEHKIMLTMFINSSKIMGTMFCTHQSEQLQQFTKNSYH